LGADKEEVMKKEAFKKDRDSGSCHTNLPCGKPPNNEKSLNSPTFLFSV
jgi:hypothetical protein